MTLIFWHRNINISCKAVMRHLSWGPFCVVCNDSVCTYTEITDRCISYVQVLNIVEYER